MKRSKRYGRRCQDDGVRSPDVRSREVPEYTRSVYTNKARIVFERTATRAMVCDKHAEERWSEWKASAS